MLLILTEEREIFVRHLILCMKVNTWKIKFMERGIKNGLMRVQSTQETMFRDSEKDLEYISMQTEICMKENGSTT